MSLKSITSDRPPGRTWQITLFCAAAWAASGCSGSTGTDACTKAAQTGAAPVLPTRSWSEFPAIVQSDSTAEIYALGDVHGDYDRLVALLVRHRLLTAAPGRPEDAKWGAGTAMLVVTGDLIDKWTQSLKVLALMQALRDSAASSGGKVIVTLGNHEAEFLADPNSNKVAQFVTELNAAGISPSSAAAGCGQVGQYLRSLPVGVRIRDWFFCHAGNTAGRTLTQLDAEIKSGVDQFGYGAPVLSTPDSLLEADLEPVPWWETAGDAMTRLGQYASALGVRHIVMGHQPGKYVFSDGSSRSKGTLSARFGILFLIDAGMSQGVDYSQGALLHIKTTGSQTTATALYADGSSVTVWTG